MTGSSRGGNLATDARVAPAPELPLNRPLGEDYNRGRSDLKVLELAMAGALPIVQECDNYTAWHDTPVLFARDADEFTQHVRWAAAHRDEVRRRPDAAHRQRGSG